MLYICINKTDKKMEISKAKLGLEVVRSKGDYVVGQISIITEIDLVKNRIKTDQGYWVKADSFELTSEHYEIIPAYFDKKKGKAINPKYIKK